MDCDSIRLLLPYLDQPGELTPTDVADVEHHLDSCPFCRDLAARERAFAASIAQAMSDVDVPSSLRDQIESRLFAVERREKHRRLGRDAGLASLAAVLLLALSYSLGWWTPRVAITADQLLQDDYTDFQLVLNRNPEAAEEFFRARGLKTEVPRDLDYSLLVDLEVVNFKGREVARLDFQAGADRARVYVLPRKRFSVPSQAAPKADGSQCSIEIVDGSRDYIYVVVLFGNATRQMFVPKGIVG